MENTQYPPLDQMLEQYVQSQTGNAPPPPQNIVLDIAGKPYQFSSPEDASKVVTETVTNYEQQLAAAKARLAELEQIQMSRSVQPAAQAGQEKPKMDPEEWARMAITDPTKATEEAFKKTELYQQMMQQLQASQVNQVAQQFFQQHPAYRNPELAQKLEGVRQQLGLGMSPQHLEAVLSYAQMNGVVPHEKDLMERLRQPIQPQMQQQNLPFPEFQQPQMNYPPPISAPPPQIRQNAAQPTSMDTSKFEAMNLEQQKQFLEMMYQKTGGNF